ncbi:hypothetical protein BD309DRAFT_955325 [Dichomitus squalens]|nr:hypothetical protein BD309DRAFT_955325 [Dichomitus squalens]
MSCIALAISLSSHQDPFVHTIQSEGVGFCISRSVQSSTSRLSLHTSLVANRSLLLVAFVTHKKPVCIPIPSPCTPLRFDNITTNVIVAP